MSYTEAEYKKFLEQMQMQQKRMSQFNPQQEDSIIRQPSRQSVNNIVESAQENLNFTQAPPPSPVSPVNNACPQCNLVHPPVRPGEICPMKPIDKKESGGIEDISVSKYLVSLRNIILSNIAKKKIKDGDKFFKYIILELTRAVEKYSE